MRYSGICVIRIGYTRHYNQNLRGETRISHLYHYVCEQLDQKVVAHV